VTGCQFEMDAECNKCEILQIKNKVLPPLEVPEEKHARISGTFSCEISQVGR